MLIQPLAALRAKMLSCQPPFSLAASAAQQQQQQSQGAAWLLHQARCASRRQVAEPAAQKKQKVSQAKEMMARQMAAPGSTCAAGFEL